MDSIETKILTMLGVSYAAIIDTDLYESPVDEARDSGVQNGQQLQQQSRLVVVSGRSQRIVQNILDFGFGGDRKADDEFRTLLDNAFKGKSRTNGSNGVTDRVDDELWRGFAVFVRTANVDRFEQISRRICRQFDTKKPSIWFMFTGLRPKLRQMFASMMTIDAFKASVEMSAQTLASLGCDLTECLNQTIDVTQELHINREGIVSTVHHIGFVDAMRAVGVTPDGYLGGSIGEVMCLYMDGLITRRQCLHICHVGRPPVSARQLWALGGHYSWSEMEGYCADRTDIFMSQHFANNYMAVIGGEQAMHELRDHLCRIGRKPRSFYLKTDSFHTGREFVPEMGQVLVDQFTKVVPERTARGPTSRWLSSSTATLCLTNTGGDDSADGFSAAECYANILLSPVLVKEAVDRLPADALVVNIAADSRLRDVALSGRPQELYVKESVESRAPVVGINHWFREIGLVFTAGHWPRINDLKAQLTPQTSLQ